MNRGLTLALLLLAFAVTLISADVIFLSEAIDESEEALASLDPITPPDFTKVEGIRDAYEENRFLFSVSVPLGYLNEYEEALASLFAATLTGEKESYAEARAQAATALAQIKRSAFFSLEQIF